MLKLTVLLVLVTLTNAQDATTEATAINVHEDTTILDLSNQGLTSLKEYNFSKYRQLEEVDLSNNDLTHIHSETFISNFNLKKLNLAGNKNLELPEFATFLIITNIEEINLSNCNIERLPPHIFDGTIMLKTVDLRDNPFEEEAIQISTLLALMQPEKLILPHIDEPMIENICKQLNIVIEVNADSIHCQDVRNGTWQYVPKEEPSDDKPEADNLPDAKTDGAEEEPNVDGTMALVPSPEETSNNQEETKPENVDQEDSKIEIRLNPEPTDEAKPDNGTPTETNANVDALALPHEEEGSTPHSTDVANVPDAVDSKNVLDTIDAIDGKNVTDTIDEKMMPDMIDGKNVIAITEDKPTPKEEVVAPAKENPEATPEQKPKPPLPMQRAVLPMPAQEPQNAKPEDAAPPPNKSEKMQEKKKTNEDKTTKSVEPTGSSTGTTVLIVLVIAVIVAGVAAFGYKFYKSRTYSATPAAEPVARELREIVIDKRTNGPGPQPNDIIEEEPLMERRVNSVEIKEIDEEIELPKNAEADKPKSEVSSPYNSGPYVPTTTPIKPPHVDRDDKTEI